ncbi:NAD(P)-binding protein, partial [Oerskovia turbata]
MSSSRPLRVAIVGAGPAGIYAADILSKSGVEVGIDLFERLPAPFGLVRYGVAPDHPR